MAGTLWIPGAERITPSSPGGTITSDAEPRAVWHSTEAQPGTAAVWAAMIRVLTSKGAEPSVLWDPLTDRLGQFFPLNLSGRALRNDGTTRTNRVGKVCIQVEVISYSSKPFTGYWKPGPNYRAMMAAIRSWGIPDVQPAGVFPKFIEDPPHNVPENPRSRTIWLSKGGHYSHSQIPGNDHGDPGAVSFPAMLAAGKPTTPATPSGQEDIIDMATQAEVAQAVSDGIRAYMKDFFKDESGTGDTIWDEARENNKATQDKLDRLVTAVEGLTAVLGKPNA